MFLPEQPFPHADVRPLYNVQLSYTVYVDCVSNVLYLQFIKSGRLKHFPNIHGELCVHAE